MNIIILNHLISSVTTSMNTAVSDDLTLKLNNFGKVVITDYLDRLVNHKCDPNGEVSYDDRFDNTMQGSSTCVDLAKLFYKISKWMKRWNKCGETLDGRNGGRNVELWKDVKKIKKTINKQEGCIFK